MSVKTRVRSTSETVVGDEEIQHQRHRARRIRNVDRQINIPTMSTSVFSYVLHVDFKCCVEKVSQFLNRPVMRLFVTRMRGTSTEMVSHRIHLKLPPTTRRLWFFSDDRDLGGHGHDKESLSETTRPVFISPVRSDLSQPTHRLKEQDTLGGILFLKASHLRPGRPTSHQPHLQILKKGEKKSLLRCSRIFAGKCERRK